jgi:hypothetical protein
MRSPPSVTTAPPSHTRRGERGDLNTLDVSQDPKGERNKRKERKRKKEKKRKRKRKEKEINQKKNKIQHLLNHSPQLFRIFRGKWFWRRGGRLQQLKRFKRQLFPNQYVHYHTQAEYVCRERVATRKQRGKCE